jgi:hypothetical protein
MDNSKPSFAKDFKNFLLVKNMLDGSFLFTKIGRVRLLVSQVHVFNHLVGCFFFHEIIRGRIHSHSEILGH